MDQSTGLRVAAIRLAHGLTQEALAEQAALSVQVIRKIEQDAEPDVRLATLRRIAAVLGVTTGELFRAPRPLDSERPDVDVFELRRLLAPPPEPEQPPDVAALADLAASTAAAYRRDDYDVVFGSLPRLIADAQSAASAADDARPARRIEARGWRIASGALLLVRRPELAAEAARRAVATAQAAGDDVLAAEAVNAQCWLMVREGRFADAIDRAQDAADAIAPRLGQRVEPERAHAWGWLQLHTAAAAVRDAQPDLAADAMRLARAAADLLPSTHLGDCMAFGHSIIGMKAVEQDVVADHYDRGLTTAARLRPVPGSPRTWHRHRLDVAAAQVRTRQPADALATLDAVWTAVPGWMRRQRRAADVVTELLVAHRRVPPRLREMAEALAVA